MAGTYSGGEGPEEERAVGVQEAFVPQLQGFSEVAHDPREANGTTRRVAGEGSAAGHQSAVEAGPK